VYAIYPFGKRRVGPKRLGREESEASEANTPVFADLDRKRRGVDEHRRDGGAGERLRSRIGEAECGCNSALGVIRTRDLRFRKPMLYPLSYEG
jgi:hypothetical protein